MRSLSKVIKGNRVLYNNMPMILKIENLTGNVVSKNAETVEAILTQNAKESAELSLRTALSRAREITDRANVEANLKYNEALKAGEGRGYEDGLNEGSAEGEKQASEMVCEAARDFLTSLTTLDMKYCKDLSETRNDCINFAFALAEKILNIEIDRERSEYKELLSNFMVQKPVNMILTADGKDFSFETFQSDGLIKCMQEASEVSVKRAENDNPQIDTLEELNEVSQSSDTLSNVEAAALSYEEADKFQLAESDVLEAANQGIDDELSGESFEDQDLKSLDINAADEAFVEQEFPVDLTNEEIDVPDEEDSFAAAENADDYSGECENVRTQGSAYQSEKFVFVRPTVKNVNIPRNGTDNGDINFEDIQFLKPEVIKVVAKKADIKDISAALTGADSAVADVFMNAMSNRLKEKVLDAMRYLGPVPQSECDDARERIAKLASRVNSERS